MFFTLPKDTFFAKDVQNAVEQTSVDVVNCGENTRDNNNGKDVLDSEDFLVSNLLLPIGSLIFLIFCTTKFGWGFDKYYEECNAGRGIRFAKWLKPYFQFVLPILILIIIIQGLI